MKSMTITNGSNLINIRELNNGAYFMIVKSNGFLARARFVKID
jgi:hypothetical protein